MTLEEMLESFYVDAGLTDEAERGTLAQEGDVERWLMQARIKLGATARKSTVVRWEDGAVQIELPPDCVTVSRIAVSEGRLPTYDEWGNVLSLREPTTASGTATVFYTAYFDVPEAPSTTPRASDPVADAAALACVDYALSRFFRKLAASRVDYRRYSTITGQAGVDAADLRDLADDHLGNFESAKADLVVLPPASFYGD